MLNVKDFGAVGDGATSDTYALRRALAAGGEIYFPAGTYLTATLELKSHTKLHFAPGAKLLADLDKTDWIPAARDPESRHAKHPSPYFMPEEGRDEFGLLYAYRAKDIEIVGGTLAANDRAYCVKEPLSAVIADENSIFAPDYFRQPTFWLKPCRPRPKMMLFEKCENVSVSGLRVERAPCFSGWFLDCENLRFEGLTVRNDYAQPSADGLHLSSCRNVLVSRGDFHCGDDCIAIDCTYGKPAENIRVENCVFETSIHAVRIYSGLDLDVVYGREKSAYVRGVKILGCRIREACAVLLMNACDGDISDIEYKDTVAEQSFPGTALCITADEGKISDVTVENLRFRGNGVGYFFAEKNGEINGVTLKNCSLDVVPVPKMHGDDFDRMQTHAYSLPYALVMRGAKNVSLLNTEISIAPVSAEGYTEEELGKLRAALGEEKFRAVFAPVKEPIFAHGCENVRIK